MRLTLLLLLLLLFSNPRTNLRLIRNKQSSNSVAKPALVRLNPNDSLKQLPAVGSVHPPLVNLFETSFTLVVVVVVVVIVRESHRLAAFASFHTSAEE